MYEYIAGAVADVLWLVLFTSTLDGMFGEGVSTCIYNTGVYELIPGFIVSMLAAIVVTLLDKAPSKEITDIFDAATAPCED